LAPFPNAGFDPIDDSARRFSLAEDNPCFEGHFAGAPILPGIAHLALALTAYARQAGRTRVLTNLREVRFLQPLRPGDAVEVRLTDGQAPHSVRFELMCGSVQASSGLMVFAPEDDRCGE
jgi:hypothetical protein